MKIRKIEFTQTGMKIIGAGLFAQSFEIETPDAVELSKWLLYNLQEMKDDYKRVTGIDLRHSTAGMPKFE